jgi:hypothetical protein
MPDVTYLASTSATQATYTASTTFTVANDASCTKAYAYSIRRLGTADWWLLDDVIGTAGTDNFVTFMTGNAAGTINVTLNSASGLAPISGYNAEPVVYEVRVVYSASTTIAIDAEATQIFKLTIEDNCRTNVITCSGADDIVHEIPADQSATITAVTTS